MNLLRNGAALVALGYAAIATPSAAASLHFDCKFPAASNSDGKLSGGIFELVFLFDTITGKAVLTGNNGVSDVIPIAGPDAITFLEELGSGAIQTTTITYYDGGAVHSRHTVIAGRLSPSQYYGECAAKEG